MATAPPSGRRLSPWRPAALAATWFGAGRLPLAPGTWGSLAALPFAWALLATLQAPGLLVAAGAVFLVGWWATSRYLEGRPGDDRDPGEVVIDEVAGQWLALTLADPAVWWHWPVAFLLFRVFDIVKPWPARRIERRKTAFAVMADDVVAGLYALIVFAVIVTWKRLSGGA